MYHWMTQAEIQRFLAICAGRNGARGPWPNTAGICWPLPPGCPKGAGGPRNRCWHGRRRWPGGMPPSTVNSMIAALNGFFAFQGWHGCRVKALRQQREIFREKARELDKGEYLALLAAADGGAASGCIT